MAKPSRRAYSLLDSYGQDYNLARMLSGAKTSELRAFFEPIEPELTDQNEYLEAIYRSNHERTSEKTAAMEARYEAKRERIYDWTEKRTGSPSLDSEESSAPGRAFFVAPSPPSLSSPSLSSPGIVPFSL